MIYKVADLFVSVPDDGGMDVRCKEYIADQAVTPDIVVDAEQYNVNRWRGLNYEQTAYMDSGWQFYVQLMRMGGMMLHSSAVELDGKAYLFSGPSGMGKSTHTKLWQQIFPSARVFNDDKPAMRKLDGVWYAYGTPWCGKDGININIKVPVAGICFLRRGEENKIRRLSKIEAAAAIITQTLNRCKTPESLTIMTQVVDRVVQDVPVFELINKPVPEAAMMSYETMKNAYCEVKK